jgi:hypothetical protein
MTRGIRNNNPLNIRKSKDKWLGTRLSPDPSLGREGRYDTQFCQFETQAYGWRAAFVLLTRTYYHTYRLYTIRAVVTKWAPPNENATAAYIRSVSLQTGIDPDEPLGIPSEKPARWMLLAWAMAIQECGEQGLNVFEMLRGWQMARG